MRNIIFIVIALCCFTNVQLFAGNNLSVTVHLKSGDIITGKTTLPKLSITTPYGALAIPIERITNVKFGIISDHTKDGAVLPDLNKLQFITNDADAKVVYNRLLAYGSPILSTIITFTQNPFYKISDRDSFTIEQLIDELTQQANLPAGGNINDAVTFDGSNYIEGTVVFTDIALQSEYGNLTFKREKIESLDITPIDEVTINPDGSYKLKANYNISANDKNAGWLNTGITVIPGNKFNITATGKIVLKSLSGGIYSPDGYLSGTKDNAYTDDMAIKYGSVVYKIGANGEVKPASSNFEGVANTSGVIYIAIYETVYDKTNTGAYNVKVVKK